MKVSPACEILALITYYHQPTLIVHAEVSCLNTGLHLYLVCAGSKGSCESAHLHRLTRAFIS